MRNKGIAAAGAILFVGAIRTDAPVWMLLVLAIFIYEMILWCFRIARTHEIKTRIEHNEQMRQQDATRWAEEWFNPYKGVKA